MIRILIVSNSKKMTEYIRDFLSSEEEINVTISTNALKARRLFLETAYDLIIINYPLLDEAGYELAFDMNSKSDASLLVMVHARELEMIQARMDKAGIMTLAKPLNRMVLYQILKFALLAHRKFEKIRQDNSKLNKRIDEIKTINQAKCLMMEYENLSEQDAHHMLEKMAMNTQQTRLYVAKMMIKKYSRR